MSHRGPLVLLLGPKCRLAQVLSVPAVMWLAEFLAGRLVYFRGGLSNWEGPERLVVGRFAASRVAAGADLGASTFLLRSVAHQRE